VSFNESGTLALFQMLSSLLPKRGDPVSKVSGRFGTAWNSLRKKAGVIGNETEREAIIVKWPAGDVPATKELLVGAKHALMLLGVSHYRVVCGRDLYSFSDWLNSCTPFTAGNDREPSNARQIGFLFLNPSSPHAQARGREEVRTSEAARTREALRKLSGYIANKKLKGRWLISVYDGPHRYSARAVDLGKEAKSRSSLIDIFVSSHQRGQESGFRLPIPYHEKPECYRFYHRELIRLWQRARTNPPGHGISLVARWVPAPSGLNAEIPDLLTARYEFDVDYEPFDGEQWHMTISSLCRTDTTLGAGPIALKDLPRSFPKFVEQVLALVSGVGIPKVTFDRIKVNSDGYVVLHGTERGRGDSVRLTQLLRSISDLIARQDPEEGWSQKTPIGEPRFGPKYPTFEPHVTIGRLFDRRLPLPVEVDNAMKSIKLSEPLTFSAAEYSIVHYAYRSLLRCPGEIPIKTESAVSLSESEIIGRLGISHE